MHKYVLSDLKVESEFEFLVATPSDFSCVPDVTIKFQDDIGRPENPLVTDKLLIAKPQDLWFYGERDLSFRVRNGNEILIEKGAFVTDQDINLYLVGSAFGVVCLQRGLMPMHCSAVEFDGKAVAFTGASGVGKSTLAAALSQMGYQHVCDDVFIVNLESDPVTVAAMPKGLKLWDHAAEALEIARGKRVSSNPDFTKSYVTVAETSTSPRLLFDTLYVMDEEDAEEFKITELTGGHKLSEIRRAIYREEWLNYISDKGAVFAQVVELAKVIRVYSFKRRDDLSLVRESAQHLISHFTKR